MAQFTYPQHNDVLNHEHDGYLDPEGTNAGEFLLSYATYMQ